MILSDKEALQIKRKEAYEKVLEQAAKLATVCDDEDPADARSNTPS